MNNPTLTQFLRFLKILLNLAFTLALVSLLFFLLAGCSPNPTPEAENGRSQMSALTATTVIATREKQFVRSAEYVGRVEAARTSNLGFELAGTLLAVHVEEGNHVEKGEVLAELDTARLEARRAELNAAIEEAKAVVELAEATFERAKNLAKKKAVSKQALDEARQSRDSSQAALRRAQAQLDSVNVDLSKSKLKAPFAGTIAARLLDEGAIASPGQSVLRILETGDLEIRAGVSPTVANALNVGRVIEVRTENSQRLPVVVERILPHRGKRTRTVDVIFTSSGENLRDGDLVSIPVETEVKSEGFWLPRMALTGSARGLWSCYVAQPAEDSAPKGMRSVEKRELEILHQDGDRVFVTGGLRDGDHVVTSGVHRLVAGQLVIEAKGAIAGSRNFTNQGESRK